MKRRPPKLDDAKWLRGHYVRRGLSTRDIAEMLGCAQSTVQLALQRHAIPGRVRRPPELDDPKWLRRQYVRRGLSTRDIAEALGCRAKTVQCALKRHAIRRRSREEAAQMLAARRRMSVAAKARHAERSSRSSIGRRPSGGRGGSHPAGRSVSGVENRSPAESGEPWEGDARQDHVETARRPEGRSLTAWKDGHSTSRRSEKS